MFVVGQCPSLRSGSGSAYNEENEINYGHKFNELYNLLQLFSARLWARDERIGCFFTQTIVNLNIILV